MNSEKHYEVRSLICYFMFVSLLIRETSPQMVLNLMKAKENVNVPLNCPAAKKPQQIISAQPKNNKHKVLFTHTTTK